MKRRIIQVWSYLDPIYIIFTRLQCLEQLTGNRNIFRIRLTRYKGRDVTLSDGTSIRKNDLLIKIHLHNVRILKDMQHFDDFKKSIFLYKWVQQSLPDLAFYVIHHKKYDEIKGIIGITLIDKGYKRLGFDTLSCSSRIYYWFKRLALYPIHYLSIPQTNTKKKNISTTSPRYLFMSKNVLCNKYGSYLKKVV